MIYTVMARNRRTPINKNAPERSDHTEKGTRNYCRARPTPDFP
jgi:hypothetical protein